MPFSNIFRLLSQLGQKHLDAGLSELPSSQLQAFEKQLENLSSSLLERQRELLLSKPHEIGAFEELSCFASSGNGEMQEIGEKLLRARRVGCLILAGGTGSRLGLDKPKGMSEVAPFSRKSLFQIFLEKTGAASLKYGQKLPLAIMTSPSHYSATLAYFEEHNWFGLEKEQVDLFSQKELPFLDDKGNWMLEEPGKIAQGPNGNGEAFLRMLNAGILEKWQEQNIDTILVIPVDNALANPWDAELCGVHANAGNEITIKATKRYQTEEKMGVLVQQGAKCKVIEYIEKTEDLPLHIYPLANINQFAFDLQFAMQAESYSLPWHMARKTAPVLLQTSRGLWQEKAWIWKCETFLFDLLNYANRVSVVAYPREMCYAPLKNAEGEASFETVRKAIITADQKCFASITGRIVEQQREVELAAPFHYPTDELLQKWQGKMLPENTFYLDEV